MEHVNRGKYVLLHITLADKVYIRYNTLLSREFLVVCHDMNGKRPEELQMLK
jgi:hypothetical protein